MLRGVDGHGWCLTPSGSSPVQRPSYQASVVSKYLSTATLPSSQYFNSTGRGIPDVSALATNFQVGNVFVSTFDNAVPHCTRTHGVVGTGAPQVIISQYLGPLSGTSAATPTWAGTLAVMNGLRSQAGKAPLGFANPALYGISGGVGTDIVAGNNKVSSCPAGFPAIAGWDAITGALRHACAPCTVAFSSMCTRSRCWLCGRYRPGHADVRHAQGRARVSHLVDMCFKRLN